MVEYDQLYDKLEAMEKAQGWRDHDSPTKHVGSKEESYSPLQTLFTSKSL